jgi:hypothetical protein
VIRLAIGQTELFADLCIPVRHELADKFPVCGVVVAAEQRKTQSLLRQAAPQLRPLLAGRSLSRVEDIQ